MFHGSTRQKIFHFLTEKQQRDRDTSRYPVTTFPKIHTPKNGSGNPAASHPCNSFWLF